MKNEDINNSITPKSDSSASKDVKTNDMLELKVFLWINGRRVKFSSWRFFPHLHYCFRQEAGNGNNWEDWSYENSMDICKRLVKESRKNTYIDVQGSLITHIIDRSVDNQLDKLFSGKKVRL